MTALSGDPDVYIGVWRPLAQRYRPTTALYTWRGENFGSDSVTISPYPLDPSACPNACTYIAGVFCAVVSHPADNLVSKLNANKGVTAGEIIKEMGWGALLTRGLPLRIIMIGTLTGLQWGIYDWFKVQMGLPTTGAAPPVAPAK